MVDQALLPAIREAIRANEIGGGSPYCLSYAKLGQSGASFGIFQGDTHVNAKSLDVLRQVLDAANCDPEMKGRILTALKNPCPQGSPLSQADSDMCNHALDSEAGKRLVDVMDQALLQVVLNHLDKCIAAANSKGWTIDPEAQLYIALWTNMTGAPDMLCKWLGGGSVMGISPPAGPRITRSDIENYLKRSAYFVAHPNNLKHMQESVTAGAKLLPGAEAGGAS